MYAENIQDLSSSVFTFEFERGFCMGQLPLDFTQGQCYTVATYPWFIYQLPLTTSTFQIITKGDRNLEWQNAECDNERHCGVFRARIPHFTCYSVGLVHSWTMQQIIDRGLLTWEDGGHDGPFLTAIRMLSFSLLKLNRTLMTMLPS